MKFKIKHLRNLLVRLLTKDNNYVCEECHHVHKRDGHEVRLDENKEHLMLHPLWYGSVGCSCFQKQQAEVFQRLRAFILSR